MPAVPIIAAGAAIVGAGAAVVGTVSSINAQKKAARASAQQHAYERQAAQNRAVRERRDAIRSARLATATTIQNAENTGGSNTSAALGTLGSIASQINSNLSFLDTQFGLSERASDAGQAARVAQGQSAAWGAISNAGMAVFNIAAPKANFKGLNPFD